MVLFVKKNECILDIAGVYEFNSVVIGQHVYKHVHGLHRLTDKSISISMREDNKCHEHSVDYRL